VRVELGTDEYRVNAEAEAALVEKAVGLYQRGGCLVRVLQREPDDRQDKVRRPQESLIVRDLPEAILREELTKYTDFVNVRKTKDGGTVEALAHPPGHVVAAIARRGLWQGIPHLHGVVSHPVLLGDGSLLARPGYDAASGLLLRLPAGLDVQVKEQPTRDDAVLAIGVLLDVVSDFPFAGPAHQAAWLSSVLTPLARFAVDGPAPLFLVQGNVAGCGKGLLCDATSLVVQGRKFSVMGYTSDREELRKAITALALEGDELVLMDNITGAFGGDVLERALTCDRWEDRILGGNRKYDGPLLVCWYGTANNPYPIGDMPRRLLPIGLLSPLEFPEDRSDFKYPDLRAHVLAHRGALLAAALTILRAYIVAGRPPQAICRWGSFDGWTDLIRGCLVWAGQPDPADSRDELRQEGNPEREALADLLAGIEALDPTGQGLTTSEIVHQSEYTQDPAVKALHEALFVLCYDRSGDGKLSPKSVGRKLFALRGRVVGGRYLERLQTSNKHSGNRWRVVRQSAGDGGGDFGDFGENLSGPKKSHPKPKFRENFGPETISPKSPNPPTEPQTAAEGIREKLKQLGERLKK
jgi:hypothetical protein